MHAHPSSLTSISAIVAVLLATVAAQVQAINIGGVVNRAIQETKSAAEQLEQQDAASTDALVKRADTELRAAERKMFGGQTDAAQEHLTNVSGLLVQIEGADAARRELPALKQKHARLQADLNRRTGKSAVTAKPLPAAPAAPAEPASPEARPSAAEPATPAPRAATPPASTAPAAKLPYAVRETMRELDKQVRSIEYRFEKMEEAKKGETTVAPETYAQEIEKMVAGARTLLDKAKADAAAAGMAAHPDLAAMEATLEAFPARLKSTSDAVAAAQTVRKSAADEIARDIEVLQKEAERLREKVFSKAGGAVIYYNDLEPVKAQLVVIEAFEAQDRENAQKLLDEFRAKYGATEDEIRASTDDMDAVYAVRTMADGIANVAKTRTAMADDLAGKIAQRLEGLARAHDFSRLERHAELRAWLAMAQAYDKESPRVKELTERLEGLLADDVHKMQEQIAARTWPAHAANAPDNAAELARVAVEWFKNDEGWGRNPKQPYTVLAVAVTGPWSVQARNILGEPTMYGLPVKLAVQRESDKAQKLARVFVLTMRTGEAKGIAMAPPFDHVTVGDSYLMNADAVK